ncbi:TPA_asm: hypothetical protein [Monosiga MELD virus 2]|nr:TPA_asm: hypothetical protein [Monosiga MELD virus 2]
MSYLKYNSNESGPFDDNNSIVTLDIPNITFDGTNSYVEAIINFQGLATTGVSVPDLQAVDSAGNVIEHYSLVANNAIIIDSVQIFCENIDLNDNLNNANVWIQNRDVFLKSEHAKLSSTFNTLEASSYRGDNGGMLLSSFVDYQFSGDRMSRNLTNVPIRIPLSSLNDLFSNDAIDASKLSNMKLKLRITKDKLTQTQAKYPSFNVDAAASGATELKPTGTYSQDMSPFYVGMRIPDDGAAVKYVSKIAFDTDGKVTLTLNTALENDKAAGTVTEPDQVPTGWTIDEFKLVVRKTNKKASDTLRYTTMTLEKVDYTMGPVFNRLYDVEPNCINAFFLFTGPGSNYIWSDFNQASCRMYLDGVPLTDRDVKEFSPLYKDRLNMTILNMDVNGLKTRTKSLTFTYTPSNDPANAAVFSMFTTPLPKTADYKQLKVDFRGDFGEDGIVWLYKQVVKQLTF